MYNRCIKSLAASSALSLYLLAVVFSLANNANAERLLLDPEKRILNGKPTTIEFFPHMVQLSKLPYCKHLCGGFLVTDRHVVTAAHCVRDVTAKQLQVIANSTFRCSGGIKRYVVEISMPEHYDKETRRYDVAVLTLDAPLPIGKDIQTAELCDTIWKRGEALTIAGWGRLENGGPISSRLMTARVGSISDAKCKQRLENIKQRGGGKYRFTKTMACAKARNSVDACQGDSGGPAYINGTVCGIVSFGVECGDKDFPSFYTSIAKVRNFIKKSILDKN